MNRSGAVRWAVFAGCAAAAVVVVVVAARHVSDRTRIRPLDGMRLLQPADLGIDLEAQLSRPDVVESAGVVLGDDWTRAGTRGVWAVGEEATIELLLPDVGDRILGLLCGAYPGLWDDDRLPRGQTITISLNGTALGTFDLVRRWRPLEVALPASAQHSGVNRLLLRASTSVSPHAVGRGRDGRPYSFGIGAVTVRSDDGRGRGGLGVESIGRTGAAALGEPGWTAVTVAGNATVVVPLELGPATERLELAVRWGGESGNRAAVVQPAAWAGGGAELRPESVALVPSRGEARRSYPLAGVGAGLVVATFAVETDRDVVLELELHEGVETGAVPKASAGGPASPAELPDIVVIVLDAARADRFGFAGYPRPTTPHIDRLARDALVFSNVFALAPYTLCSVPTMYTGASFLRHGVVGHRDRLGERFVTIAERLSERGYRTAAFSATPNNSRAKGFDQGFDEFYESWVELPEGEAFRDPFVLTSRVLRWLDRHRTGQPLFLFVHYIPPHAPYDPQPRFDVFSSTDYRGPVDGRIEIQSMIGRRLIEPTAADVRQMSDLYDGNLRRADAAVRPLLRRLEERERWPQTAVLVTSDHGEAFLEHDRLGHNNSLYDEMLAVPFVLRLPEGAEARTGRTDRLATLADLAPTVAGLAGTKLPGPVDGVDLLAPAPSTENRSFVCRTAGKFPEHGLRTARWKAITSPLNYGRLYDLERDPGETDDLALEHFELFSGFEAVVAGHLTGALVEDGAEATAEIGETEREMLRELGYLE